MCKIFIAELHDIGKLVDKDKLKKYKNTFRGHTFEDFDFSSHNISPPASPSWWGQYHHKISDQKEIKNWQDIDTKYREDLFLLIIADHLASSFSRVLPNVGSAGQSEGVLKLWNHKFYDNNQSNWAAFSSDQEFEKLFEIFEKIDSHEKFLEQYWENLLLTPEDKAIPRNITSLYTHLELVGKIYRVLKKHCKFVMNSEELHIELNGKKAKSIKEAEGGSRTSGSQNTEKGLWQARFIKCRIGFPHSFVRLQDINLLVKRNQLVESFVTSFKDYVMFSMQDFISLFLPMEMDLNELFKEFLNNGFYIECIETVADLGILRTNLDKKVFRARQNNDETNEILKNRETKVYRRVLIHKNTPEEIRPPICDICQMQPAKERIKENIREWICDKCFSIRESGSSFNYPEEWLGSKVVWFKFNLDHDKLESWLQMAFINYINNFDNLNNKEILIQEFRSLGCHSDFVKDYIKMLRELWKKYENLGIKRPIPNYDEIGVCKYSGELLNKIINEFIAIYDYYFYDCEGDVHCPISLSLSISPIKYPVREHWRYFEKPKGFLNIRSHNIFEQTYTEEEIKWLMKKLPEIQRESSHFLYKLMGLSEKLSSDITIKVEILKNQESHSAIYNLYSKFEISSEKILNFFRIIEGKDEIIKA